MRFEYRRPAFYGERRAKVQKLYLLAEGLYLCVLFAKMTGFFLFLLKYLNLKRMKKFYSFLTLALTFTGGALVAQPTLTSAVIPQVGYTYNMISDTDAVDLPTFTVSAGSGTAQTWNYTAEFNIVYGQATSFVAPSSGTGSSNFPNATVAVQQSNLTDWIYFLSNANGFYVDGIYLNQTGGVQAAVDLVPNSLFMPANNATYGFNNNTLSTATFTTTAQGNTFQIRHRADRTVTADAFGSLTTPTATYPTTLRLKTFEASIDSIFIDVFGSWTLFSRQTDSSTAYMWAQNSNDALVMQIDLDKANNVTKASYLQSFSFGIAQIDQNDKGYNLFPNPSNGVSYLTYTNESSGNVSLQVFDMNGRLVGNLLNEDQAIGKQKIRINVESLHLPKGLYFLQLKNSTGTQNIKLSVN